MTQRDQKTVLLLVLGLVGLGGAFVFLKSSFLDPIADYNRKIEDLKQNSDLVDRKIGAVVSGRKLLQEKQALSLPINNAPVMAMEEYTPYLQNLLISSGLTGVDVKPPSADFKVAPAVQAAPNAPKKPGHIILPYTVSAKGSMAGLVTALDNLQRTPVLQRIKELTLRYQENAAAKGSPKDNLAIQMTMEAMIVAGTKPNFEPALKPDTGLQLPSAAHPRRYADIAKKNIFIGLVPYREPPEDSIGFRMAEFVMLDQVDAASKEAYLRFQLTQTKDMRLKPMAGFDTILVMSEDGSKELVRGKVLRVDQRDVYFQVKDDVYALHIGESIGAALGHRPLSEAELENLQLTDLVQEYDPKDEAQGKGNTKKGNQKGKKRGP